MVAALSSVVFFGLTSPLLAASADSVPDEVLIKYRETVSSAAIADFEKAEKFTFIVEITSIRVRVYRLPSGATASDTIKRLSQHPLVLFIEPNHMRYSSAEPAFGEQWSLNNTGQIVNGITGPAGIDINWPEAMALFRGTSPIIVAVVDSGVAIDHRDIILNAWANPAELNGRTNVDDDQNGYVDDAFGWDFYGRTNIPLDENGHGTLVASIIAGHPTNSVGGTGICPTARVMALRVANQFGRLGNPRFARSSDVALAFDYAMRNGARIVNCSFGGGGFSNSELLMLRMMETANILVVAAAGNGGSDGIGDNNDAFPTYPASYAVGNVISVAAMDRSGALAPFSNRGVGSVHLAAPGTSIFGADVTRRVIFSQNFQSSATGWTVGNLPGNQSPHTWVTGTFQGNTYLTDRASGTTYAPNTNTWVRSPQINLAGVVGARLTFTCAYDLADDWLFVEGTRDGVSWQPYGYAYGTSDFRGVTPSLDVSELDGGLAQFRFALYSNGTLQGAGVIVDDVAVSAVTVLDPGAPRFTHNDGTSFAAPIVSGVAALVMSQRPELTVSQVRNILLSSVRQSALLAGRVSTGGSVDAQRALELTNAAGNARPAITAAPQSRTVEEGGAATFTVTSTGSGLTYQWQRNGVTIAGATNASYTISAVTPADAGQYVVVVSNSGGSTTSEAATLGVSFGRLTNVSVRSNAGVGNETLIVGFSVAGGGRKQILLRGIGPTLGAFGVTGTVADPQLRVFNSAGAQISTNDDWGGTAALSSAFGAVGAFALPTGSRDAAVLITLDPGPYSVQLTPASGAGVALVEGYDADRQNAGVRLSNLSVRSLTGVGPNVLIVGFSISGTAARRILIRGVGPSLANFGVTGVVADPVLRLFNSGSQQINENNDWAGNPSLASTFTAVGAFALPSASRDAALLVTLSPGSYTAQLAGANNTSGVALVEVYDVP